MDMLDRMQTGRFKVFRHLNDWFEEFRLYHRVMFSPRLWTGHVDRYLDSIGAVAKQ